jgi:hypothetical protein
MQHFVFIHTPSHSSPFGRSCLIQKSVLFVFLSEILNSLLCRGDFLTIVSIGRLRQGLDIVVSQIKLVSFKAYRFLTPFHGNILASCIMAPLLRPRQSAGRDKLIKDLVQFKTQTYHDPAATRGTVSHGYLKLSL